MIKIVIFDCNPIFKCGLEHILKEIPEYEIIDGSPSSPDMLSVLEQVKPEIIIIDDFTFVKYGDEVIAALYHQCPEAKIIVLTDHEDKESFIISVNSGARGYLLKSIGTKELLEAISLIACGGATIYTSRPDASSLQSLQLAGNGDKKESRFLSNREKEVLLHVARGESSKEIADICCVSETTVKAHLRKILEKLNSRNRAQAVAVAINKGILDEETIGAEGK